MTDRLSILPRAIRCLTVKEPYASAIILGPKPWENRGWSVETTGPLLIHAGRSLEYLRSEESMAAVRELWPECPPEHKLYEGLGFVLGICWLGGSVPLDKVDREPDWASGPQCFRLEDRTPLPRFRQGGLQRIFEVPTYGLPDEVRSAMAEWMHKVGPERAELRRPPRGAARVNWARV